MAAKKTTAREAARVRKGGMTATEKTKLKKELKPLKEGSRSKAGASTAAAVAKRFGITAREARDIATALGTKMTSTGVAQGSASNKNLVRQIAETGRAALTGKPGTSSDKATMKMYKDKPNTYTSGKKRK
jgi:hypothetical protein